MLVDPDGEKVRSGSKSEEPQAADVDTANIRRDSSTKHHGATMEQIQQLLIRKLRDAAEEETEGVKNCNGLLFFLIYVLLFVVILSLQLGIGLGANKLYATLTDNLFSADVVQDGNGGIVTSLGGGYADLYTWYEEVILAQVFVPPACGDGICEAPDEYPEFSASDEARSFLGCKADCGAVATEPVRLAWWWVLCVCILFGASAVGGWYSPSPSRSS